MVRTELITKSPLRILEKSTHGGVTQGGIGVIAGPKGTGKTACLVHIATDQLLQEKHVIHISFSPEPTHIVAWYEEIFTEISRRCKLDNAMDIHDEIIKNRIVMNFKHGATQWPRIEKSLKTLIDTSHFSANVIVVDGYDFSAATPEDFHHFKKFGQENGFSIWFSATPPGAMGPVTREQADHYLAPFLDDISVLILLTDRGSYIHLELLKDHENRAVADMHLKLDPQILLIAEEE
jgi:hypothetical protein